MSHESTMRAAYRNALFGTWIGIAVNFVLGIVKVVAGALGHSFALLSDGLHSFSDLVTSIGTLIGFRIAQRPPDANHPYGHSRAEAVVGAYVALALGIGGAWVAVQAIRRIAEPHATPYAYVLWIAAGNIVVKEALFRYKLRLGRRLASTSLIADAWDHRSDVLSSAAVLIGVAFTRFAGWHQADGIATLVVAATLIVSAIVLLKTSTDELMDRQQDPEMLGALRRATLTVKGVLGVEKLWVRKAGLEFLVDIHVEVDPHMTVRDSHAIAHDVQRRLLETMPTIHQVLVHIEPHGDNQASSPDLTHPVQPTTSGPVAASASGLDAD